MYIGVDPGLTGAIACLSASGVYISVLDLPTMASGAKRGAVKNRVNVAGVKQILNGWLGDNDPDLSCVYLEDPEPMPRFADGKRIQPGSAGVKSLGLSIGLIEGLCIGMGIRIELLGPASGQGDLPGQGDCALPPCPAVGQSPPQPGRGDSVGKIRLDSCRCGFTSGSGRGCTTVLATYPAWGGVQAGHRPNGKPW